MKIMIIIGTRPEAIKMFPVIKALKASDHDVIICSTGQHRSLIEQVFQVFEIRADFELNIMREGQTLNELSAKAINALEVVIQSNQPDWILVHGDTTSAFCAGLASFHCGVNLAHVEAGLRTGNLSSPFPEEGYRSMLSKIAKINFTPTKVALKALLNEGIKRDQIYVTGNTIVDAIEYSKKLQDFSKPNDAIQRITEFAKGRKIVFVTCHRRENHGSKMRQIFQTIEKLSDYYKDYLWLLPVHPNPNISSVANDVFEKSDNIFLIDPLDYLTNLQLLEQCALIVTDSGGLQEEAPSFRIPVVILREHTERPEGVDLGIASLTGTNCSVIESDVAFWLENDQCDSRFNLIENPYGDGLAAERIVSYFNSTPMDEFGI